MNITGKCHCGEIKYEAEINKNMVGICHCTDCQSLSGSAFRVIALTVSDKFKLISGELKSYVKIAESGSKRTQTFCPNCGSPIYSSSPTNPEYSIRVGTIDQRSQLVPKFQLWHRSAQPWVPAISGAGVKEQE